MISDRRHQWRAFTGGELSEEMYGRVDLPRRAIGLKECSNTLVTPQGSLENRAGSRFISTTDGNNPAWLVPFVRQDGQGFLLEFSDSIVRIVGSGNVVGVADPGDEITVSTVDVWVPADGAPQVPVVFTTSGTHGFSVGDEVQLQDFTLVNPDAAGNNILQGYMNQTWYVHSVPTTTTFTLMTIPVENPSTYNFGYELGDSVWTYSGSGSGQIDATAPVRTGSNSLKLGHSSNPNATNKLAVSDARLAVTPGRLLTMSAWFQSDQGATPVEDSSRIMPKMYWYNSAGTKISETLHPEDLTLVSGQVRIHATSGLTTPAADGVWTQLTFTDTVPAGAAFMAPAFNAFWGDTPWSVDDVVIDYAGETWNPFSAAPYNGLVNGGVVILAADVAAVQLAPTYTQSHIRFASYAQFVDDLVIAHPQYATARIQRVDDNNWDFSALTFNQTLAAPANIVATPNGTPGATPITYNYTVTTVDDDLSESDAGTPDAAANELRTAQNNNSIVWDTVTGFYRFNVYKDIGGSVPGFIGSAEGLSFTDDNIIPDFTKQPPADLATFDSATNYPGVVSFHEQRMILANTILNPQTFYASGLAAFDYYRASFPPQEDQAFSYKLSFRRSAPILHSLALDELLFFTSAGVFRIADDGDGFTPTTVRAVHVAAIGSHELAKPQADGVNILFPADRGGHLYMLEPVDTKAGYKPTNLSITAAHIIEGKDWVQTAMARAPYPIWYGLRDDGTIAALTFMPEQEVFAWHTHSLPGAFVESIAVVPEGANDSLYVISRRTISSNEVRYIERIEPHYFGNDQAEAFFVDSGITYRGDETDAISGLDHLEGEDVMVLADGRVLGPYTVTSGAITLDTAASVVHVGLQYESRVETLPLAYDDEKGFGLGVLKNVSQVWLRLKKALGLLAGVSFETEDLFPLVEDAEEELGEVPALRNGTEEVDVHGVWGEDTTICLFNDQPLPFTVTGLSADYVDGG